MNKKELIELLEWVGKHPEGFHTMYHEKDAPLFWGTSYQGGRVNITSKELVERYLQYKNEQK
jgi:hypothetical protein